VDAGATATYQHNGQGQRVRKDSGPTTTLFVYDEAGNLIGEYGDGGAPLREHVWFNGAPVAVLVGSNKYYVHTDHLGTPRVISDGAEEIWRWVSTPFGVNAADEDPDDDSVSFTYHLRFPGQYYDQETGLHYNYFRTYDPSTGRYLESDPIGLLGGLNAYGYGGASPLSFFDPLGLEIVGQWIQKPTPFVSDARVEFGGGFGGPNARRPDDWWKIWNNWGNYKSMEHRVSVEAGFNWSVRCTDTEECSEDSWDLNGGWQQWFDVWIPISTPAIPHPFGYWSFLTKNTYNWLIKPAMSQAMDQVTQAANIFGMANAPTWICKNYPRQGN
jgi:RHS repeat-associated protein